MSIVANNGLITIGEAARILLCSEATVRAMADKGDLGAVVKVGRGTRLLDRAAVESRAAIRADPKPTE